MAMKEHPFVVTTTLQGDGVTIKYDITKPNRSDAVGKAYWYNPSTSQYELSGTDNPVEGKVIDVDDDHKFTAAYMGGGLKFPLGTNATVAKGDQIVGAQQGSQKGYVKAAVKPTRPSTDLADLAAATTAVQEIIDALKGRGTVHEFDSTHALVAIGA